MIPIPRRAALLLAFVALSSISVARAQSSSTASVLCEDGQCAPAISAVIYAGRDAFKLTDGRAEAIIVPQIGRIMSFGKVGGPNLLWNLPNSPNKDRSWKNYGGDKNWLAPQSSWPDFHARKWPPDAALDGASQSAEVLTGGKLQMTTPLSASGIRITRTMYVRCERRIRH